MLHDLENICFDENGLIPAIIQDWHTKEVLTLAYMNKESLEISLEEGYTCFYSRSRKTLWRKGKTSGNTQRIVSIKADCDSDALLIQVVKAGPACHTGKNSCFFKPLISHGNETPSPLPFTLNSLFTLINARRQTPKEGSYTTYLFEKGLDKILKKVGEESTEVIIAAKNNDTKETIYETADLCYHIFVLLAEMGIAPEAVLDELSTRHIIDVKVKQEKMGGG